MKKEVEIVTLPDPFLDGLMKWGGCLIIIGFVLLSFIFLFMITGGPV